NGTRNGNENSSDWNSSRNTKTRNTLLVINIACVLISVFIICFVSVEHYVVVILKYYRNEENSYGEKELKKDVDNCVVAEEEKVLNYKTRQPLLS
ncbi:hypothetical protein BgiBS90_003996, partial [Biomphalaria glabrata]